MIKDDKKMSEAERAQAQFDKESKILGYSTNKFGAVKIMNLHRYKKMDKNKDLIGDEYDRSEKFVEISEKDNLALTKAARNGNDEELQKEALKIKVSYISKLDIFMEYLRQGKVSDKATGLSEDLLDALRDLKVSATSTKVDDSAVKAREKALSEAEQKIADERKALDDERALFLKEKEEAAAIAETKEEVTPAKGKTPTKTASDEVDEDPFAQEK